MESGLLTVSSGVGASRSNEGGVEPALPPGVFLEVVEQSSIAISITDPQARIIFCNPAFTQLTGYSRGELQGRNHNVLASQQTPRSRYQAMWQALADLTDQDAEGEQDGDRADHLVGDDVEVGAGQHDDGEKRIDGKRHSIELDRI